MGGETPQIKNKIVAAFGLKTSGQTGDRQRILNEFKCAEGERVGLFKVFHHSKNETVLGEDDKHLNFRVSLFLDSPQAGTINRRLTISTTVVFNNWFGKLYFLPVKPFHKLIVRVMLRRIIAQLEHKSFAV